MADLSSDPAAAAAARKPWLDPIGTDVPYDAETLFPETQGMFIKRYNTQRSKLFVQLKPLLHRALGADERVRFLTAAIAHNFAEQYFAGAAASIHNRVALILTNKRLLVVYIKSRFLFAGTDGAPADIKNQIRLDQIKEAKKAGSVGALFRITLADGKKLDFQGVPKPVRVNLEGLFSGVISARTTPLAAPAAGQTSMEHLCPSCLTVVPGPVGTTLVCPNEACRIAFRDPAYAAKLSAMVPGIGDIYLRHYLFGAWEFIGSLVALGIGLYFLTVAALSGQGGDWGMAGFLAAFLIVGPRVVDYFLTRHMARKGLVPLAMRPIPEGPNWLAQSQNATVEQLAKFPGWAYGLFGVGAIAMLAAIGSAIPSAHGQALVSRAVERAEQGDFKTAEELYAQAKVEGEVTHNERAELAIALYDGGDWTGGDRMLDEIGGAEVEENLANRINGFLDRVRAAGESYGEGLGLLLQGQDGWSKIDVALNLWKTVKRPVMAQDRDHVRLELAALHLHPDRISDNLPIAQKLLDEVKVTDRQKEMTVIKARIASEKKQPAAVKEALGKLDTADLEMSLRLLALEARAHASPGEAPRIAAEAERLDIPPEDNKDVARRAVLMLYGGKRPELDDETAAFAADLAAAQGWPVLAKKLAGP